ncbi:hypothetical protein HY792_00425 [Candidatus Desantisbacteria bacterium]|nr:hypothetical protein [Candidatus Desantisbacteria bacterium]
MKKILMSFFVAALMLGIFMVPQIANADIIIDDQSSGFEKYGDSTHWWSKNVGYNNKIRYYL